MPATSTENNIAIVTGATGNLGHAVVKKFLSEKFFVVGTVMESDNKNLPVNNFEKVVIDLADEKATQKFIDDVVATHTKIDAAVLTAGGFAMGNVEETKTSDMLSQYKLNFETAYNAARPIFLQMMHQKKGRIFLIGSKPGLNATNSKGMIAYGLSKSLIFRLAELMNEEAKGTNVVVNVIVPSTIDKPANRTSMLGADFNKWVTPEAIADVIYWHCTTEATVLKESVIKVYNNA